tara:strand:- start:106 stop:336 length:231 start_codon:yes stop_codon:yes gene_type:complete
MDYIRMIDEPREILEEALTYLGIEWDCRILEFHKLNRAKCRAGAPTAQPRRDGDLAPLRRSAPDPTRKDLSAPAKA